MIKGKKTRLKIVAEAAKLFNQNGFEGGSMSALMQATGLEKGGIYRHFATKEELAAEAFDYAWQIAMDLRMHDLDSVTNSVDRLKRFVHNFAQRRSPVPGGCPLLNTAIDADDGNAMLRERARKALHQWKDCLSQISSTGLKRKEIKDGTDPKKLATLIISSLEGALMVSRLEGSREALLQIQSYLNSYLENEVRQSKPRKNR
ncbi:MAG TPA: TetR/AcrR family transcriptional regulator [Terriglobales bacterium]|nr:TetR/AcrR family transcriptional regulator [Terriglobales bacterium]